MRCEECGRDDWEAGEVGSGLSGDGVQRGPSSDLVNRLLNLAVCV